MSRKPRLNAPGEFFHVMARGIDGMPIFKDDYDRIIILKYFAAGLKNADYRCYAWALMNNHYHFLLRSSEILLDKLMRPLNANYAQYYNKKYGRRGYLFQDRFKSIVTQDQKYVEEIIRYIHLNPIRSGICKTIRQLDVYRWTGHSVLLGNNEASFQDTKPVLKRFGKDINAARKAYTAFIEEGIAAKDEPEIIREIRKSNNGILKNHDVGCWVIGDRDFVSKVLRADKDKRLRIARYHQDGWDLDQLLMHIAVKLAVPADRILYPSRNSVFADARHLFCFLGYRELAFSARNIADFLHISPSAVYASSQKGRIISETLNEKLPI
ncbi:MAG: hypothetical protein GF401_11510 [Chitinivibrionales bacterium]|nr:hypothetical protein [Chitinivibrionales bacterium]